MLCVETLLLVIHPYSPCASSKAWKKKTYISPVYKISSQWRISVGVRFIGLNNHISVQKHSSFCLVILYIFGSQGLNEASLNSLVQVPTLPTSVVGRFSTGSKGDAFPFLPPNIFLPLFLSKLDNEETNCFRSVFNSGSALSSPT